MVASGDQIGGPSLATAAGRTTLRGRIDGVPRIELDRQICSTFELASSREWLVTNGIGGFAAGTVSGAATRRYHGLLVAALAPPLGRTLLVAGLEVNSEYLGRRQALSTHEYVGGTIHPDGFRHLEAFILNGGVPVWVFALGDARLTQSVWMGRGANTTYVRFRLESASGPVRLKLAPLCTYRDYHAHSQGGWRPGMTAIRDGVRIEAFDGARPFRILCADARFQPRGDWYWNVYHRREMERGLDDREDLYCPGDFTLTLEPGCSTTLVCSTEAPDDRTGDEKCATAELVAAALAADQRRRAALLLPVVREPGWVRQLALAADQFIVERRWAGSQDAGATVIAGYPWFGDWGRDTMIALPGLTLATGRAGIAARILRTFAGHVSQGMLPNRFPDGGEAPAYNTVDATLWYFHAIDAYRRATGDEQLIRDLWPILTDIIAWHLRGTRDGIAVDPEDGLLRAGEPGVQLTWMDAKVGDWVVTPRIGKPVEVNALWHHALVVMAAMAEQLGDLPAARQYEARAAQARESFRQRFWYDKGGYLFDVVDGPPGQRDDALASRFDSLGRRVDAALRPNQIFAVSLPSALLDERQSRAVVSACQRELLTPMGLRSLAASDPRYVGEYRGGPRERDAAYHQGTVWPWLLGPFALAHFRAYGQRAEAQAILAGIGGHLAEAGVGSVSEIFDGDAPHRPRGCVAQAWSVAEILRAWFELGEQR